MIPVATYDVASILVHLLVPPSILVPILPSWRGYDDKQSQFIASIHERRVLRIVGCTDNGKASITQALGIAPLLTIRQGIAHIGKVLMTIGAYQLMILLAIEVEARLTTLGIIRANKFEATNANLRDTTIERLLALLDASG